MKAILKVLSRLAVELKYVTMYPCFGKAAINVERSEDFTDNVRNSTGFGYPTICEKAYFGTVYGIRLR